MNMSRVISSSIVVILLFLFQRINAQNNIEVLSTPEAIEVEASTFKPLDDAYKFTIFSLNQADYDYKSKKTSFMTYSILSYDLYKGFGPTVGARFLRNEFVDKAVLLGGLQYTKYFENFFIASVFTAEFTKKPDFEFFITTQYNPKITEKFTGYFEFQSSFNFNNEAHLFSFQKFRIGVDLKKFQTGISLDNYQFGEGWEYDFQPGMFVQLTL